MLQYILETPHTMSVFQSPTNTQTAIGTSSSWPPPSCVTSAPSFHLSESCCPQCTTDLTGLLGSVADASMLCGVSLALPMLKHILGSPPVVWVSPEGWCPQEQPTTKGRQMLVDKDLDWLPLEETTLGTFCTKSGQTTAHRLNPATTCYSKVLLANSHTHLFIHCTYCLWLLSSYKERATYTTGTLCPAKPKIFTVWSLPRNCWPSLYTSLGVPAGWAQVAHSG